MRTSRRLRIAALLLSLILLGVLFTAGYCRCTPDGVCVWVEDGSDAVGCLYGVEPGIDVSCRGSGGGGGGPPPTAVPTATSTPTPLPTPIPTPLLRSWVSTASVVGTLFNWCAFDQPCLPPDHTDVAGEHAVDIGASAGTPVYFYDPRPGSSGSNLYTRRGDLVWARSCSDGTGGAAAIVTLKGIDSGSPTGWRYLGQAVYRHIDVVALAGAVSNGELLGTIAANASTNASCWTGPHVHQGVGAISANVTFEHDTAGYQFAQCYPYVGAPYPDGWSVGYPVCYQIRWVG